MKTIFKLAIAVAVIAMFAFVPSRQSIDAVASSAVAHAVHHVNTPAEVIRVTRPGSDLDFYLVNQTGYAFDWVYMRASGTSDWGSNILKGDLGNGQQVKVFWDAPSDAAEWDLGAHYKGYDNSSKNYPVWNNIDLTKYNKITLKWDATRGVSTITKELVKM